MSRVGLSTDMSKERHSIAAHARLRDCKDRQVSFQWEIALDQRLDDLVSRATSAGERTNRRELLATLLLHTHYSGEELGKMLRRYRTANVADALLEPSSASDEASVIEFIAHGPGPRLN